MRQISFAVSFCNNVFDMLRRKGQIMTDLNRICCLVLDEISLKCGFKYYKEEDKIMGYEHSGESDESDKVSNHALVFMATGLFDRWKQPLE